MAETTTPRDYLVTRELPVTVRVSARSPEEAIAAAEDTWPLAWGALARRIDQLPLTHEGWVGDWLDDIEADLDPTQDPVDPEAGRNTTTAWTATPD